jgi:hypothetical protein
MNAYIGTEYLTHKRYVIRVQAEGHLVETIPPTRGTLARLRNQACAHRAQTVERVEAGEIPEAWDRRAGGGRIQ